MRCWGRDNRRCFVCRRKATHTTFTGELAACPDHVADLSRKTLGNPVYTFAEAEQRRRAAVSKIERL